MARTQGGGGSVGNDQVDCGAVATESTGVSKPLQYETRQVPHLYRSAPTSPPPRVNDSRADGSGRQQPSPLQEYELQRQCTRDAEDFLARRQGKRDKEKPNMSA